MRSNTSILSLLHLLSLLYQVISKMEATPVISTSTNAAANHDEPMGEYIIA